MTDEARLYWNIGKEFAEHNRVLQGGFEYVRKGDAAIYTHIVEGYFSIFKRDMRGIYQHCGSSTCTAIWRSSISASAIVARTVLRTISALKNIAGRRATYRRTNSLYA